MLSELVIAFLFALFQLSMVMLMFGIGVTECCKHNMVKGKPGKKAQSEKDGNDDKEDENENEDPDLKSQEQPDSGLQVPANQAAVAGTHDPKYQTLNAVGIGDCFGADKTPGDAQSPGNGGDPNKLDAGGMAGTLAGMGQDCIGADKKGGGGGVTLGAICVTGTQDLNYQTLAGNGGDCFGADKKGAVVGVGGPKVPANQAAKAQTNDPDYKTLGVVEQFKRVEDIDLRRNALLEHEQNFKGQEGYYKLENGGVKTHASGRTVRIYGIPKFEIGRDRDNAVGVNDNQAGVFGNVQPQPIMNHRIADPQNQPTLILNFAAREHILDDDIDLPEVEGWINNFVAVYPGEYRLHDVYPLENDDFFAFVVSLQPLAANGSRRGQINIDYAEVRMPLQGIRNLKRQLDYEFPEAAAQQQD